MKKRSRTIWRLLQLCLFLSGASHCPAQGIPEPSITLFGVIRNTGDNNARLTFGTLTWQYRKVSSGRTVTLTTQLTNILDQFSYVLEVPIESFVSGFQVSSNALDLGAQVGSTFDRSQVFLNTNLLGFATLSQNTVTLASTNRGLLEQVDLTINAPPVDQDGNGLADDWETRFFGFIGVDPNGDPDGDGFSNRKEYLAGTDPTNPASFLAFTRFSRQPPSSFQLEWPSVDGRRYVVERSANLRGAFASIRTNILATPPLNTLLDTNAIGSGPFFYRLRLQ